MRHGCPGTDHRAQLHCDAWRDRQRHRHWSTGAELRGNWRARLGSGFSYGGVPLQVGPDVEILAHPGVLGPTGQAVVTVRPPFPALDRYYVQGVLATNPNFLPPLPLNGVTLVNADAASVFMPIGGIVNANGTPAFITSGVSVSSDWRWRLSDQPHRLLCYSNSDSLNHADRGSHRHGHPRPPNVQLQHDNHSERGRDLLLYDSVHPTLTTRV